MGGTCHPSKEGRDVHYIACTLTEFARPNAYLPLVGRRIFHDDANLGARAER